VIFVRSGGCYDSRIMRSSPLVALVALGVVGACSGARYDAARGPGITGPVHVAEGSNEKSLAAGTDGDAGAALGREPKGSQPDPEALRQARQYEYEVVYDHGKLHVANVRGVRFANPVVTARQMGRFAIELWIGHELVERVRFDFPLVAAEDVRRTKKRPLEEPPSFAAGVVAAVKVFVPASTRATRAVLVDRATGSTEALPWPPDAPLGPPVSAAFRPPADAGASDATGDAEAPADAGPG
jgi:hypothetical protein